MKNLFAILLFVLVSVSAPDGFAQTRVSDLKERSGELSKQRALFAELPDSVLNTELQLLGGKTLKLSDYSGKAIVLNLFATWCGPCRFESPDLAKLHHEFKDRGLVVIELSTEDPKTSKESIREWVWNFRLPYPVGWATQEVALELMQERRVIPQAFVIARDRRILKRFIGYDATKTLNLMREAVEEALK